MQQLEVINILKKHLKFNDKSIEKLKRFVKLVLIENKNYGNKIASYFKPPLTNPKTNDDLKNIKIETINKNIRILEENKNLPILGDDIEDMIKDFLIK